MNQDDRSSGEEGRPLPPALQNWQVVDEQGEAVGRDGAAPATPLEIEGEATVVAGADASTDAGVSEAQTIPDRVDDLIIATAPMRRITVRPGAAATLPIELLNNSAQPARFTVHVEGWIDEAWLDNREQHLSLGPGGRATVQIRVAPPRRPGSSAGDYHFAVVVRSPDHPRRSSRLGACLTVLPYTEFTVGRLQPAVASVGLLRRRASFTVPIVNLGNNRIALQAQGHSAGADCLFVFQAHEQGEPKGKPQTGVASIELEPQQSVQLDAHVALRSLVWFGAEPVVVPISVAVGVAGQTKLPRTASAEVVAAPLVRLWHLLLAGGVFLAAVLAVMLLAFGAQVALRLTAPPAQPPAAAPVPPIVIVLNQPAPVAAEEARTAPAAASVPGAEFAGTAGELAALPVVSAEQVTGPGTPAPAPAPTGSPTPGSGVIPDDAQPGAVQPVASPPTRSPGEGLTYAQMFQEVALRYDLDWRALAAQAYVESGFDALALGNSGDMGLMQVLPSTWREWAPAVEANDPFDAYSNALVAAAYLDYLRGLLGKRGLPEIRWMLVAYNWGPDKLAGFLDGGGTWETLPDVRRQYADDILRIATTIP